MKDLRLRRIFDRRKTATKSTEAPVHLELTKDRVRKYFDTGIRLYAGQWSHDLALAVKCKEAREINRKLDELEEAFTKLSEEVFDRYGASYTLAQLIDAYKKRLDHPRSFMAFAWQHLEDRSASNGTRRQHRAALNAIEASGIFISFSDVTYHNVAKFDVWLRKKKGLTHQVTIHGYHKRLKVYIHAAMACGYIEKDPYQTFKVSRGESKGRRFLGKEELNKIVTAELEDPALRRIRDLFLFQCYTGLAYADLATFEYKNTEERDGMRYLRAQRHKTNTEYFIYLLPPAIKILEAYNYKIPILSQQKYNVYLKALALACGLTQKLTTHMARHTFATTVTLANGVPLHVLQKMLGHTSVKTTQIYAKTLAEDVQQEFQRLKEIF